MATLAEKTVHSSHDMTNWTSSMVQIAVTPRFGKIRSCKKCGAEQVETVAGKAMHDQLKKKCGKSWIVY